MSIDFYNPKVTSNLLSHAEGNILAKGNLSLIIIKFLTGSSLVRANDISYNRAFLQRRFSKNNTVISQKKVRNNRSASTYLHPMNCLACGSTGDKGRESISTYEKYIRGDGISLAKPTSWNQIAKDLPIELEREGHTGNIAHNPIHLIVTESLTPHHPF